MLSIFSWDYYDKNSPESRHRRNIVVVVKSLSCIQLFATPWAVVHQAPLSMGFPRQEYRSGLPCPPPGNTPEPGIKPTSSALPQHNKGHI